LDFPSLGSPITPRRWRNINLYTISYGHGIALSLIHISTAISAVVNGGILQKPSLAKVKLAPQGKRIFKEKTSEIVNQFLENNVKNGTGRKANTKFIEIGGKTGTAEKPERGGYNKNKTITSFFATIPAKKPKYTILILVDEPKAEFKTGGYVVAPIIKNLVEKIYPILNFR
jgi:cell division protein FtsI (penicillin-binding protein 3)